MVRKILSQLISLYAVAFAFAALATLRLPAVAAVSGFIAGQDIADTFAGVDWRRLSILLGGPYLLASIAFFISAGLVAAKKPGAGQAFLLGVLLGFPMVLFVDFHPKWWLDPTTGELLVTAAAITSLFILGAIFDLRPRTLKSDVEAPKIVRRTGPVPAAIRRQRARFASDGQRMMAKRNRQIRWTW